MPALPNPAWHAAGLQYRLSMVGTLGLAVTFYYVCDGEQEAGQLLEFLDGSHGHGDASSRHPSVCVHRPSARQAKCADVCAGFGHRGFRWQRVVVHSGDHVAPVLASGTDRIHRLEPGRSWDRSAPMSWMTMNLKAAAAAKDRLRVRLVDRQGGDGGRC